MPHGLHGCLGKSRVSDCGRTACHHVPVTSSRPSRAICPGRAWSHLTSGRHSPCRQSLELLLTIGGCERCRSGVVREDCKGAATLQNCLTALSRAIEWPYVTSLLHQYQLMWLVLSGMGFLSICRLGQASRHASCVSAGRRAPLVDALSCSCPHPCKTLASKGKVLRVAWP